MATTGQRVGRLWRDQEFLRLLGTMPDAELGERYRRCPASVRRYRVALGVAAFGRYRESLRRQSSKAVLALLDYARTHNYSVTGRKFSVSRQRVSWLCLRAGFPKQRQKKE